MKIKCQPEDFSVEELTNLEVIPNGPFSLYTLEKKSLNTVETLQEIAQFLDIPFAKIAYGGRKDKHALTKQYISFPHSSHIPEKFERKGYVLTRIGYSSEPMGPKMIEANRFQMIIRDLSQDTIDNILSELETIREEGYFNYFDDQRFGSWDKDQGFFGEKILKGHWNGALKIYLTHLSTEDRREDKTRKQFFLDHWGQWSLCRREATTATEIKFFEYLTANPNGHLKLLQQIPAEEVSLYFAAFQGHLWNEVIRFWIEEQNESIKRRHPGMVGDYIFYNELGQQRASALAEILLPTASSKTQFRDPVFQKIYDDILKCLDLRPAQFNLTKIRQAYFKTFDRKMIIIPNNFGWHTGEDELYAGKIKLILKFDLPPGGYATMLVKRIFSK